MVFDFRKNYVSQIYRNQTECEIFFINTIGNISFFLKM